MKIKLLKTTLGISISTKNDKRNVLLFKEKADVISENSIWVMFYCYNNRHYNIFGKSLIGILHRYFFYKGDSKDLLMG